MGSIDDLIPVEKFLPNSLNHLVQTVLDLFPASQKVGLGAPRQELHRKLLLFRH